MFEKLKTLMGVRPWPTPEEDAAADAREAENYARLNGIKDDDWQCRFHEGHTIMPTWKNQGHAWIVGSDFWRNYQYQTPGERCKHRAPNVYAILISSDRKH